MKHKTYNMKHKRRKTLFHVSCFMFHERGFSLLELIIYIGIVTAISGVFVAIIVNLNLSSTKSKVETEVQQNLRVAMQAISQTLRGAQRISAPVAGASGSALTAVVNGQNVQYALGTTSGSTGVLKRTAGTDPAENITSDSVIVSYLSFTTMENSATTTSSVVTATATSTQYAITVQYNSTGSQFSYSQSATSTDIVGNKL
ncbi:hypothetical protein A3C91_00145 [Candidatus Azambacteria bacterium RIFCSPHIGHO2_02_FULL_52_12]|uniref:Type II secretion system protein n=1 Tax=Candidatus Azambacteria bacterium RIFCSPLOWO2_01_FULL_46_25 TaxID=1797298 RepID=A0A1F5BUR1_9BACT|nr:MAG: hypothetical protein A3C91_00145 [Candidatus Azambacteria bacterium RIFCSPHIGHO2_02_FULL_52_12]OGD34321.1 MAG: hypothetical protein A2988_02215 [Candidatus Azambacteria bacterium RIFCSPLOWO2_01_FULL_46_25]OGD37839.1 MAG: hypothetical protein A2850_03010 [Candidatus Azambacteria bacterium RIFCSPHIGHO2_01_FULL_51_74]